MAAARRKQRGTNQNSQHIQHCAKWISDAIVIRNPDGLKLQINSDNSDIEVRYHADGRITVSVNGLRFAFNSIEASRLTLDTGRGDSSVKIYEESAADDPACEDAVYDQNSELMHH